MRIMLQWCQDAVSKMAYPAKTRIQSKTTNTNTITTEWQFPASVALTLATGCTGNSSMDCIRHESLHVKQQNKQKIHFNNETRTKEFKTFYLPGFFTQSTLLHKMPLSNTSENTAR